MPFITKNDKTEYYECSHPKVDRISFGGERVSGGTNLVKVNLYIGIKHVPITGEIFNTMLENAEKYLETL